MTDTQALKDRVAELESCHEDNLRSFAIGYEEGKVESEDRIEQLEAALEKISSVAPACACIARRG